MYYLSCNDYFLLILLELIVQRQFWELISSYKTGSEIKQLQKNKPLNFEKLVTLDKIQK